ncbi:MAG: hypothetical protein WCA29_13345, partial [Jiangellales bacterium]
EEATRAHQAAVADASANGLGYELALLELAAQELAHMSDREIDPVAIERAVAALTDLGVTEERTATIVANTLAPPPEG